jgi:fumarate hydratase subunit beta
MSINISLPFNRQKVNDLRAGDRCFVSGTIYSARDKAHQRICEILENGETLPFELEEQILYYMGPSPVPDGQIVGSAGPTTSSRMDPFSEMFLKAGMKASIGKGKRSIETRRLYQEYKAIYFSGFGGAGALAASKIVDIKLVAFEDLGPEAVYKIEVKDFPVVVINDIYGEDLYEKLRINII